MGAAKLAFISPSGISKAVERSPPGASWSFQNRVCQDPLCQESDPKVRDSLCFSLRPMAVIIPAKSHPEVIVAAVAARDEKRARTYAQSYHIPNVHTSYQALLDDPTIDAVYIALPNRLHYEWAMKALKAGKHVLLEKPSVSNASEARSLFRSPLLAGESSLQAGVPLVLLDAVHIRFHPAWQKFLSYIDSPNISEAISTHHVPKGLIA